MATVQWVGNAANSPMTVTLKVTAVAVGGTLTATLNGKSIVYTCVTGDTVNTAAAAWQALLSAATAPPEFGEESWAVSTDTITASASVPGVPFAGMTGGLTSAGAGGATVTQTTTSAGSSQSDVGLAANWLRAGSAAIPVNGDDVVLKDSSVPLLYNLAALVAVTFNSYARWQSHTGRIGLPDVNANGYQEYRPTYFKFVGSGTLTLSIGVGDGSGPTLERYNVGAQQCVFDVLAGGQVDILGTNAANVLTAMNATVDVAMAPAETSTIASAKVDGGATLNLGSGCTFSGTLTVTNASANLFCAPATLNAYGSQVTVGATGLTFATVLAEGGSTLTWDGTGTITALTLRSGSTFDKSGNPRGVTITNATIDVDSCQVLDPLGAITWTNAAATVNPCNSGPFVFNPGRTVKIT